MKIVICTGGFDPIHKGHIEYFKAAKKLGDKLIIGLNSDDWLIRKKGKYFMDWENRASIIKEFKDVTDVIQFDDSDDSARDAIRLVKSTYSSTHDIIFVNGGDRTAKNIPEMTEKDVEFVFGVGGENKLNSSSWVLNSWENWILSKQVEQTQRVWGYYEVLSKISDNIKIKRLVVYPGKSLSYQKHNHRDEFWIVEKGTASILLEGQSFTLNEKESLKIPFDTWHQIQNLTSESVVIFEVQHGDMCIEEDIIRI